MTTESEEIERIFQMSDEELRWELRAEGLDPDEVAARGRALMDEVTAQFHARKAAGE
jgi:hypothetical protein